MNKFPKDKALELFPTTNELDPYIREIRSHSSLPLSFSFVYTLVPFPSLISNSILKYENRLN